MPKAIVVAPAAVESRGDTDTVELPARLERAAQGLDRGERQDAAAQPLRERRRHSRSRGAHDTLRSTRVRRLTTDDLFLRATRRRRGTRKVQPAPLGVSQ